MKADYNKKRGRITFGELYKIDTAWREWMLGTLSDAEIAQFLRGLKAPRKNLPQMTAAAFFAACLICYKANKTEKSLWDGKPSFRWRGLSPRDAYLANADGRDEGLRDVPLDDADAFSTWMRDRSHVGGHPWEIMRGGNSTHVNLYPHEEDNGGGWSFALAGKRRICEVVRSFNALRRAKLPAFVYDDELISRVLTGEENMFIVPRGISPKYCYWLFPGEKTEYYMNMPFDVPAAERRKIVAKTFWYPDKTPEELYKEYDMLMDAKFAASRSV